MGMQAGKSQPKHFLKTFGFFKLDDGNRHGLGMGLSVMKLSAMFSFCL